MQRKNPLFQRRVAAPQRELFFSVLPGMNLFLRDNYFIVSTLCVGTCQGRSASRMIAGAEGEHSARLIV